MIWWVRIGWDGEVKGSAALVMILYSAAGSLVRDGEADGGLNAPYWIWLGDFFPVTIGGELPAISLLLHTSSLQPRALSLPVLSC